LNFEIKIMTSKIKKIIYILFPLAVFLIVVNFLSAAMQSTNYQIWADTFSQGGGENQASDNYNLKDTLGEAIVGTSSSTADTIRAGYREIKYFTGREVLTLTVSASSLDFGTLSQAQAKTVSHTLAVDTNSENGLSVVFTGSTLTCSACAGANTIAGIGAGANTSKIGTSQFGFNVIYSASTAATPRANEVSPYSSTGQYAFHSGDQIISSSRSINATTFNVNYIANIKGTEPDGAYATTITFTATANF